MALDPRSLLTTFFWGSLAAPAAFLGPIFLCIREVYQSFNGPPALHIPFCLLAVSWLAFGVWKSLSHLDRAW